MRVGNIALRVLTTAKSGYRMVLIVFFSFLLQKSSIKPNSGTARFGSALYPNLRGHHFSKEFNGFSRNIHLPEVPV